MGTIIDRLLPEPIGPILELRDTLGLSAEQTARLEAIRDSLRGKNDPIRADLTRAFAAGTGGGGNPAELFERYGPRLNQGRRNAQAAMEQARGVLSAEQWERLPAEVRDALTRGPGQMQIRRGPGG
jgi:hypothetical protein